MLSVISLGILTSCREGGTKAWKEMQRRQREYFSGSDSALTREVNGGCEKTNNVQEGDESNDRGRLEKSKGDEIPGDEEGEEAEDVGSYHWSAAF